MVQTLASALNNLTARPRRSIRDLERHRPYLIQHLDCIIDNQGPIMIATLSEEPPIEVALPNALLRCLSPEVVASYNASPNTILYYRGMQDGMPLIDFVEFIEEIRGLNEEEDD